MRAYQAPKHLVTRLRYLLNCFTTPVLNNAPYECSESSRQGKGKAMMWQSTHFTVVYRRRSERSMHPLSMTRCAY